jgi:prepilin-type N-terminal cleavage/methylation domain-containing protein
LKKKGFTLVEVIVSVGILSFGLILVVQGFTQALSAIDIAHNNLKAGLLAEEKITEFILEPEVLDYSYNQELGGEEQEANTKYTWVLSVEQQGDKQELNQVFTDVSWVSGRRKGRVSIVTYLRIPVDDDKEG